MHDVVPFVTVYSDFQNPEFIVKKILECEDLPASRSVEDISKAYPWFIDTKYYEANVIICPVSHGEEQSESISLLTEGLVLYFDSKNITSFNNVTKWAEESEICPEVSLLVCDDFEDIPSEGVERSVAVQWCLERGYELVELGGEQEHEGGDYDIITEKRGAQRIIEALQTHTWSNLEMKSGGEHPPSISNDIHLDDETEEFCELFSQLRGMKESLQSLPPKERKMCAEQVVATFWKAIGGDQDELGDLEQEEEGGEK